MRFMKPSALVKTAMGLALLSYAITARLSPQTVERLFSTLVSTPAGTSERYTLVAGSIYDGDTFRVSDGSQEIKVRLCGVDGATSFLG